MYRKISAVVIPTLIAAGILGYMLFSIRDDLSISIQHIIPLYFVIAVVICLCAWWLRGWRYHSILKSLNYNIGVTVSTACIFVSQTVNLIVPARLGDFVRVFILKHQYNSTYSEGVSSIVVERIFDIFTVAILGALSLLFVLNTPPWFTTVIFVSLNAGFIFFIFLLLIGKLSPENKYIRSFLNNKYIAPVLKNKYISFLFNIWFYKILLNILCEVKRASFTVRSFTFLGTSSIIIWLLDILVCYAVVCMFELQVPFAMVVLAVVIGNLVKAVPLTPGGMGTYEAALAITFGLAGGVSAASAILISVIDHLIKNLVTLVGGIVSIYYFGDWVVVSIKTALYSKLEGGKPPVS
jgi:uncharacterized protein (TIRG00374 family)